MQTIRDKGGKSLAGLLGVQAEAVKPKKVLKAVKVVMVLQALGGGMQILIWLKALGVLSIKTAMGMFFGQLYLRKV